MDQVHGVSARFSPNRFRVDHVEILRTLGTLPGTAHLTSQEAALYIGTTSDVLRVWRSLEKGPRFRGRGHFVRYTKSDLDEFMAGYDHRFDPAA